MIIVTHLLLATERLTAAPHWFEILRKIHVLRTKRSEVEQLFPKAVVSTSPNLPKDDGDERITYRTDQGYLIVQYSSGECPGNANIFAYNVPVNVVIEAKFTPNGEVPLEEFDLDSKAFTSERVKDVFEGFVLTDKEHGLEFVVLSGKVSSFSLFPRSSMDKLLCTTIDNNVVKPV